MPEAGRTASRAAAGPVHHSGRQSAGVVPGERGDVRTRRRAQEARHAQGRRPLRSMAAKRSAKWWTRRSPGIVHTCPRG